MRDLDHILTILRPIMTGMAKNLDYSLRPMAGTDVAATRWSLVAALPAFVQLDIIANNLIDQKVVELSSSQHYSLGENSMY
jgi:hypothetical protein